MRDIAYIVLLLINYTIDCGRLQEGIKKSFGKVCSATIDIGQN